MDISHRECGGCTLVRPNLAYSNGCGVCSKTRPPGARPAPPARRGTFALLEGSSGGPGRVASASCFSPHLSSSYSPAYLSLSTKSDNSKFNHGPLVGWVELCPTLDKFVC